MLFSSKFKYPLRSRNAPKKKPLTAYLLPGVFEIKRLERYQIPTRSAEHRFKNGFRAQGLSRLTAGIEGSFVIHVKGYYLAWDNLPFARSLSIGWCSGSVIIEAATLRYYVFVIMCSPGPAA